MKRVIVTGDDFGLSPAVNEGIEQAHRKGILTTASLMVGAPAAADAVARAQRLPQLKVGLHVVVVCGRPLLPPETIPGLVERDGNLPGRLARAGVRFYFLPEVRRQLRAEIRAQFEAFRATGLALDHVNSHNHMHLHPTVLSMILEIGPAYGMRAVRIPREPTLASWRVSREALFARVLNSMFLAPWVALLAWRVRRAGLRSNDYVFGLHDTGAMNSDKVLGIIGQLPDGVSELYFHPATDAAPGPYASAAHRACAVEFDALTSPKIRNALAASGAQPITFSDLDPIRP